MPFAKGQSGNPAGRPARADKFARPIARAEKRIADKLPSLIDNLITLADEGDRVANIYLIDRILGRPTEYQEITGAIQTEEVGLSDDDRAARIFAILQRARERATGSADGAEPDLDAAEGAAD